MLAVITGASSGIGKELAYRLAERNYDLVLVARREDRLREIKKDIENYGQKATILPLDLSDIQSCHNLINYLKNQDVDIFINNAGYGIYGESRLQNLSDELKMIELNIISLHYLTREILSIMKSGSIVNISSMAAFLPTPLLSSYAATKAYVYSYSQAIRYELIKSDVPINILTVCPGPVKTEFNAVANASPKMKGLSVDKCVKSIIKGIDKKKPLVIPGFSMKLLKFFIRFTPNWLLNRVSYKIQANK